MINNENLIGNSKHMTDFLGNSYDYECLGCSMGKKEIIAPGGTIYEDETFLLTADPEIPLNGFLIISCKRHIQSLIELTKEEQHRMIDIVSKVLSILKELKITQEITLIQEERSKHFHLWIFPNQPWMVDKFGKGVSFVRDICSYAQEHATEEEKKEIISTVEKIRNCLNR